MKNKHISSLLSTILVSIPLLTACDVGRELARSAMDVVRNPQTDVGKQVLGSSSYKRSKLKNLEFTCVKEQFPSLPQEADQLYRYALYHDFKNRWLPKPGVLDRYLPYYRIAAANGHWQANLTLQEILLKSKDINIETRERRGEGIYWNEKLMKILPASAHYWWSLYIDVGYGPKHGADDSIIYLRKAADLGNAKAQYEVRELIMKIEDDASLQYRLKIRNTLQECAATQQFPNADAAQMAAASYRNLKQYDKSLFYSHQGTKAGKDSSAQLLSDVFYVKSPRSRYKPWGIPEDKERSRRYEIISDYLIRRAHLKPELNVHDLDEIVPLPPEKLPSWDGKIAIQRFVEGPAPAKPSDELVRRLAQQAGLDPNTGLPK
ncbi:hypothetical protein HMPREF2600_01820 [Neisseria sp. HMSC077D05]|uniref:DUF6396 domain-containing protein n=1 Tax=Neisseria sp. HMSC077D05 TaxID=1715079 RepID=UPI0008A300DB|nr:DUF6396 domain-containing protein [Neisseria sp. HMSC077D05]OFN29711.1 hypothetical protein HMPREF2600_01820 [Neisseria sp. HMSC077D05]